MITQSGGTWNEDAIWRQDLRILVERTRQTEEDVKAEAMLARMNAYWSEPERVAYQTKLQRQVLRERNRR
jgi:hypothetical protein